MSRLSFSHFNCHNNKTFWVETRRDEWRSPSCVDGDEGRKSLATILLKLLREMKRVMKLWRVRAWVFRSTTVGWLSGEGGEGEEEGGHAILTQVVVCRSHVLQVCGVRGRCMVPIPSPFASRKRYTYSLKKKISGGVSQVWQGFQCVSKTHTHTCI